MWRALAKIGPKLKAGGLAGGRYDFDVLFARHIPATTAAPDPVTAVDEELGLKLKGSKGRAMFSRAR